MDVREGILTDPEEPFRAAFDGLRASIWTAMPVNVQKDSDGKTVKLQITIKAQVRDAKEKLKNVEYPLLDDVPIHFNGGGGDEGNKATVITHPVKTKDEGIALFMTRPLDTWFEKGDTQNAQDLRTHHMSDAMYIPGVRAKPRELKNISTDSHQLRSVDGKHTVDHHPATGTKIKSVDKDDKEKNPFADAKKFYQSTILGNAGIKHLAQNDDTAHKHEITHELGHVLDVVNGLHKTLLHPQNGHVKDVSDGKHSFSLAPDVGHVLQVVNGLHKIIAHPDQGLKMLASNGSHTVQALPTGVNITSSSAINLTAPNTNVSGILSAPTAAIGAISGLLNSGGGAGAGIGAGAMATGAASTNVGALGGDLSGNLPNPIVVGCRNITNANTLPVAANNAAAATAGVTIGGLYRSGGNPDTIYVRNA